MSAPGDAKPRGDFFASAVAEIATTETMDGYFAEGYEVAGKYIIESILGEGATSVVYVARRRNHNNQYSKSPEANQNADEDTDPPELSPFVALKVIRKSLSENSQIVGRFRREAEILKRLDGPHVLRVFEVVEHEGLLVMVLEYVQSNPLDQKLVPGTPLDIPTATEITLQVCAGLATAHAAGVVHRDLKPANVLFAMDSGDHIYVKVADFGLAKLVHGDKTTTGLTEHDMIFGTPEYMAPEQARGEEVDHRADLYAAGCMLFEMLVGEVPFRGRSPMVTMTAHLMEEPPKPRQLRPDGTISASLEAVVLRALAKDPQSRYSSARALAEAITMAQKTQVVPISASADALGDTDLNVLAAIALAEGRGQKAPKGVLGAIDTPQELPHGGHGVAAQGVIGSPQIIAKGPGATLEGAISITLAESAALRKTLPSPATSSGSSETAEKVPSSTIEITGDEHSSAMVLDRRPPWVWIAMAVVFAVIAIAVGVTMGAS